MADSAKNESDFSKLIPSRMILMGRIGAAHGLRGQVRITSFTQDPLGIADYSPLFTNKPDLSITITKARLAKNVVIAKLAGVDDRTSAEALNGLELFMPRERLSAAKDEDEYLHTDLIGLEARLEDGTPLGKIVDVPNYGATDLLEIGQSSGQTQLLPFTREVVPEIHVGKGYVLVRPPAEVSGEPEREVSKE